MQKGVGCMKVMNYL